MIETPRKDLIVALLRAESRWGQPRRSCYFQGRQLNPNKLTVRRLHQSFAEGHRRTLGLSSQLVRASGFDQLGEVFRSTESSSTINWNPSARPHGRLDHRTVK